MTTVLGKYNKKTVAVSEQHWELLKQQGHVTESMDDVIGRLLKSAKSTQVTKESTE